MSRFFQRAFGQAGRLSGCVLAVMVLCVSQLNALSHAQSEDTIEALLGRAETAFNEDPAQATALAMDAVHLLENGGEPELLVRALSIASRASSRIGNYTDGLRLAERASDLATEHVLLGSPYADAQDALGIAQQRLGRMDLAYMAFQEALEQRQAMGLEEDQVRSLTNIASLNALSGEYEEALKYFTSAQKKAEMLGMRHVLSRILINASYAHIEAGQAQEALSLLEKARAIAEADQNPLFVAHSYHNTGEALVHLERDEEARPYLLRSLELSRQLGIKSVVGDNYYYLATIAFRRDELDMAQSLANDALAIAEQTHENLRLRKSFRLLSEIAQAQGDLDLALSYLQEHLHYKNEVFNRESARRSSLIRAQLQLTEKEHQIALLTRDQQIQKLQLARERSLRHVILASVLVLILIITGLVVGLRLNMRARRAVSDKAKELLKTKNELARANRAKSDLLATTSHEVRTPLNGILGMAQILLRSDLDEKQRNQIQTIYTSGQALITILNDILDISKIEAGRVEVSPRDCCIRTLIGGNRDLWQPNAQEKGLEFNVIIEPHVPDCVHVDPNRIQQILFNLISNAIKVTQSGHIIVRVGIWSKTLSETYLLFEIIDTGPGIPETAQETLFNRYNHGELGRGDDIRGTGLGLHICQQLTKRMGGDIGLYSEEGKGTRFWFTIPFVPGRKADCSFSTQEIRARKGAESSSRAPASERSGRSGRVLLAEDNEANQQLMTAILSEWGFDFEIVETGRQALTRAQERRYDLVLMDARMPDMNGVEATKAIRQLADPHGRVPIIALTADALDGDEEGFLEAGANSYVAKPINMVELAQEIHRLTGIAFEPA